MGLLITSVAPAYSTRTSWRPYHGARDDRVAMSEINGEGSIRCKSLPALLELLGRPGASS